MISVKCTYSTNCLKELIPILHTLVQKIELKTIILMQKSLTILENRVQSYIKRITHHDQVEFIPMMQGGSVLKKINVRY